jgi:hypothetical protein
MRFADGYYLYNLSGRALPETTRMRTSRSDGCDPPQPDDADLHGNRAGRLEDVLRGIAERTEYGHIVRRGSGELRCETTRR